MARWLLFWSLLVLGCSFPTFTSATDDHTSEYMSREEREALKEEARDMFYHAYNAYMDNAYPADELMPLSCKGRYRGSEPNRGDIDSTLGNFSLTLVDTLDTLVVLGDLGEFENAVKLVARDVNFDTDVIVSLFEINIRMLGGLLSGHILAEYLQQRADIMPWYRGELLNLAKDLGYRFLPAFNTTTGIPYGRINLKYGMKGVPLEVSRETCTACAGSMILEMAALSRLTGEMIFEEKAQKAMDVLWRMRHRGTDLMGSVLNVHSGDWVRRDSGVGAGIDSYYEYCLKAYILLGDEKYLGRFNKHYQAIMKYVSQGPMLLDVHMHRPNTNSKNFMDALLAFWPGLQVLKGDIRPAVETHEMLYQVMQRHNFIPEAFTTDFQVHWGHHPLRPEFLESTYFLYRATGDHYYLTVGRKVLKSLQTYARVPCGYAAVSDVRTNKHDDTMDSFVLSETFKYLFLLFAEPSELVLDLDEFIFTTEGHLLPLTLASIRMNISSDFERDVVHVDEFDRTCPNSLHLFPASVRQPLRNMVEDICPRRTTKRRLSASQFQANNLEHRKILYDMGITILTLSDGRVQLFHTFANGKTPQDSEEGLLFMQEMAELSKMQSQQATTKPQSVSFVMPNTSPPQKVNLVAGPARFGPDLQSNNKATGKVLFTIPRAACSELTNADELAGKIAIMDRGNCMFIEKARRIQKAGAIAGIVLDNVEGSSAATSPMFAMSSDGKDVDDVEIPVVFLFSNEAVDLLKAFIGANGELIVTIGDFTSQEDLQLKAPTDLSMLEQLRGSLRSFLTQQATPQNPVDSGPSMDNSPVQSNQDGEKKEIIDFGHLRAEIVQDSFGGEVRITAKSKLPQNNVKKSAEFTNVEKQWYQLKEIFVERLHTAFTLYTAWNRKVKGMPIRTSFLFHYYYWVMEGRGTENTKSVNLSSVVLWFLKELSEVPLSLKILNPDAVMDVTKEKILKQYLYRKMDVIALNLDKIANKINRKYAKLETMLRQLTEANILPTEDNLFRIMNYMRELFESYDAKDEPLSQLILYVDNLYMFVNTLYRHIFDEDKQKESYGDLEEEDHDYWDGLELYIRGLQKGTNKPANTQNLLQKATEGDPNMAYFTTDNNESRAERDTIDLFDKIRKSKDLNIGKSDDFEDHLLMTVLKAARNSVQKTFQKFDNDSLLDSNRDNVDNKTGNSETLDHSVTHKESIHNKNLKSRTNGPDDVESITKVQLKDPDWHNEDHITEHMAKDIGDNDLPKKTMKRVNEGKIESVSVDDQKTHDDLECTKMPPPDVLPDLKNQVLATDKGKINVDSDEQKLEIGHAQKTAKSEEEFTANLKESKDSTIQHKSDRVNDEL